MTNSNELIRFRGFIGQVTTFGSARTTGARFGICIDKSYRDPQTKQWVEKKKWVNLTTFGQANVAQVERLKAAKTRVEAHCEYELREWNDANGTQRSADTFVVRTLTSYTVANADAVDAVQAGIDRAPSSQPSRSTNDRTKR